MKKCVLVSRAQSRKRSGVLSVRVFFLVVFLVRFEKLESGPEKIMNFSGLHRKDALLMHVFHDNNNHGLQHG